MSELAESPPVGSGVILVVMRLSFLSVCDEFGQLTAFVCWTRRR